MNSLDRLARITTIVCLSLTVVLLVRPNGIVRMQIQDWRTQRQQQAYVRTNWDTLAAAAAVHGSPVRHAVIVEFLDYQCVYCRAFEDSAEALVKSVPTAAVVIRHLPNPANSLSREAALSVICADEQGGMAKMHRYLLASDEWRREPNWVEIATRASLADTTAFRRCLTSLRAVQRRSTDSAYAAALRIQATPALITSRSGVHLGIASLAEMKSWLRERD